MLQQHKLDYCEKETICSRSHNTTQPLRKKICNKRRTINDHGNTYNLSAQFRANFYKCIVKKIVERLPDHKL